RMPDGAVLHDLVIPADRHRPVQLLYHRQPVILERGPGVLRADLHALAYGRDAGADVRHAIHIHQAVRTVARGAEQSARAVIFKAWAEDARAVGGGGRRGGVARLCFHLPLREAEFHGRPLPGREVSSTSLVTVLRTASSHCRHPERWNHHSFWMPAALTRL